MNRPAFHIGLVPLLVLSLMLVSCAKGDANKSFGIERISSCSIEESPFAGKDFTEWATTYHQTVSRVIGADVESLSNAICPDTDSNLPAPTNELRALAEQLTPWKTSFKRRDNLSEADMGAVLLEFLRTYECAMLEYQTFLYSQVMKPPSSASSAPASAGSSSSRQPGMTIGEYNTLKAERERKILEEIRISRQTLHRTLGLTGRLNRLRPMFYDINCFVAASLDLRNQLGLAAEVGSCLPRIRDTHNSLRDLKDL